VSQVFAGQKVGVKQVGEHVWLVTFMHCDLGYFDYETGRLEPIDNPFGPSLLPLLSASGEEWLSSIRRRIGFRRRVERTSFRFERLPFHSESPARLFETRSL
jgi:hypothetical protein